MWRRVSQSRRPTRPRKMTNYLTASPHILLHIGGYISGMYSVNGDRQRGPHMERCLQKERPQGDASHRRSELLPGGDAGGAASSVRDGWRHLVRETWRMSWEWRRLWTARWPIPSTGDPAIGEGVGRPDDLDLDWGPRSSWEYHYTSDPLPGNSDSSDLVQILLLGKGDFGSTGSMVFLKME